MHLRGAWCQSFRRDTIARINDSAGMHWRWTRAAPLGAVLECISIGANIWNSGSGRANFMFLNLLRFMVHWGHHQISCFFWLPWKSSKSTYPVIPTAGILEALCWTQMDTRARGCNTRKTEDAMMQHRGISRHQRGASGFKCELRFDLVGVVLSKSGLVNHFMSLHGELTFLAHCVWKQTTEKLKTCWNESPTGSELFSLSPYGF